MEPVIEIQESPYHEGQRRLLLGAKALLDDVLTYPQCPVFLQSALRGKTTWQKRSEFTIRKTLTAPGLAPQWVGTLLAWGAWVCLEDSSEIPLLEALDLPGMAKACSVISLPLEVPGRIWAAAFTGSTPEDFPIVWALVVLDTDGGTVQAARFALTGVWRGSVGLAQSANLLVGERLNDAAIDRAVNAVMDEVAPNDDYRGSAAYRRAMAGVIVRRALGACLEGVEA